ncbi:MAG: hypothetical protein ACREPN_04150 [Rudaea sp.]
MRATFAVIPRQQQRDEKANTNRNDQNALDHVRPRKFLCNDVDALQKRKRAGHIGNRPLHQLALLEAFDQVHRWNTLRQFRDELTPFTRRLPQICRQPTLPIRSR